MARRNTKKLLFSYGSNNPTQLSSRLNRPVVGTAARLPHYGRVFRGFSSKWGGGVASIEPDPKRTVFGYVEPVTERELQILDGHEGVANGIYRREEIEVEVRQPNGNWLTKPAIAYVHNKKTYSKPSDSYLRAVVATINAFWSEDGQPVTIEDIPLKRNPGEKCCVCGKKAFDQYSSPEASYWFCEAHYLQIVQKFEEDPPVLIKRARSTGTKVALYREGEAGEDTKWATVCEDHGGIVYHYNKVDALSELLHPERWCPDCQELRQSNPKLTISRGRVLAARRPLRDIYSAKDFGAVEENILVVGPFGPISEFFGHDKSTCVAYFLQDNKDRDLVIDAIKTGDIPIFQQHLPMRMVWQVGGSISLFWKHPIAKKYIASALQFHFEDWKTIRKPEGERVMVLTHMAVKPRYRRNKLNALLIDYLISIEKPEVVVFHDPTEDGKAFMKTYGGEEYHDAVRRLGAK